jgi:hypothetical protein
VFETVLLPQLAFRRGRWVIGPTFTGSRLLAGSDGDLAAAGLLLELKTSKNLSLAPVDVLEIVRHALLDFENRYRIDTLGVFNAATRSWPPGDSRICSLNSQDNRWTLPACGPTSGGSWNNIPVSE